jgi:AraC-like DNA-binding protein
VQRINYSSTDLDGGEELRKEKWISSLSSGYANLHADPVKDIAFKGELSIAKAGNVSIGSICGTVKAISRSSENIAAQHTNNLVLLLNAGQSKLCIDQSRRSVELDPGASVLIEQCEPSLIRVSDGNCNLIAAQTEREHVRRRYAQVEDCLMSPVPSAAPIHGLVQAYLTMLVHPAGPALPLINQFVPDHIADIIAAVASSGNPALLQGEARFGLLSRERLASARRYIRQHLDNPLLDDQRIAEHISISNSQLRKDFEREGLSVGRYIREQRLDKALTMLRDPACRHYRIIDIAFACGFRSLVTFNRAFRNTYNATPSEVRPDV